MEVVCFISLIPTQDCVRNAGNYIILGWLKIEINIIFCKKFNSNILYLHTTRQVELIWNWMWIRKTSTIIFDSLTLISELKYERVHTVIFSALESALICTCNFSLNVVLDQRAVDKEYRIRWRNCLLHSVDINSSNPVGNDCPLCWRLQSFGQNLIK